LIHIEQEEPWSSTPSSSVDQDEDAEMDMSLGAPLLNQKWVSLMSDVYGKVQLVNQMLNCLVLIILFVSCRLVAEVRTIH
jgi:hypothetical protein